MCEKKDLTMKAFWLSCCAFVIENGSYVVGVCGLVLEFSLAKSIGFFRFLICTLSQSMLAFVSCGLE